jgi:UDPglucose 6-dehydrogenase
VPVTTAEKVTAVLAEKLPKKMFDVVSNPEFLREGVAVDDFMKPDRVVIGTKSEKARKVMKLLYEPFVRQGNPIYFMDERSAEMTKYAANSYLATRISFMNEIANVCDRFGINVEDVRAGMGSDSRIGPAFLRPGCGYGGSCFPKDVQALVRIAQSVGVDPIVLNGVEARNKKQKQYLFEQLVTKMGKDLDGRKICVWGLAFKPDTDDMREASSIDLIRALCNAGATVAAHDPVAREVAEQVFADLLRTGKLVLEDNPLKAAKAADAVVLVTEWAEYKKIDIKALRATVKGALFFDGRNHIDPASLKAVGFYYAGVGRA